MDTVIPLDDLEVGAASAGAIVDVLVRGLGDTPLAVAAGEDRVRRFLARLLDRPGTSALAARLDHRAVGAVVMSLRGDGWLLGPLAVEPGLRGRGAGTRLLRVGLARVDATGGPAATVTDSGAAADLLARFGFSVTGHGTRLGVATRTHTRAAGNRARPAG